MQPSIAIYTNPVYPWVIDFSKSLVSNNFLVYIFSGGIYGNYPWKNLNIYQRSIVHLPSGPLPNFKLFVDLLRCGQDVTIFLGAEPFAGLIAFLISGLRRKKRIVIVEENSPLRSFSWYLKKPLLKYMYLNATFLIAESLASELYVKNLFGVPAARIKIIPHGIELRRFRVSGQFNRFLSEKPKDKVVFLFPGELSHVKGADILIDALQMLMSEGVHEFVVWLRLSGPLLRQKSFSDKLDSLLRAGLVKSFPDTSYAEMPLLYAASDAVLVPSALMEGQSSDRSPNALLEGLASSRPTIATPVGGIPTIAKAAVLYVEPNNPSSLARGIKLLASDTQLRVDLSTRSAIRANFLDMKIYAKAVIEIIKQISSSQGRKSG